MAVIGKKDLKLLHFDTFAIREKSLIYGGYVCVPMVRSSLG